MGTMYLTLVKFFRPVSAVWPRLVAADNTLHFKHQRFALKSQLGIVCPQHGRSIASHSLPSSSSPSSYSSLFFSLYYSNAIWIISSESIPCCCCCWLEWASFNNDADVARWCWCCYRYCDFIISCMYALLCSLGRWEWNLLFSILHKKNPNAD